MKRLRSIAAPYPRLPAKLQGGPTAAAMISLVPTAPQVVDHPAVQDRLARLRDASTPTPVFRRLVEELGQLLAYEATRSLPHTEIELQTPVALAKVLRIATPPGRRADPACGPRPAARVPRVVDDAVVAHLGFYRDPEDARRDPVLREPAATISRRATCSCSTRCSPPATPARRR